MSSHLYSASYDDVSLCGDTAEGYHLNLSGKQCGSQRSRIEAMATKQEIRDIYGKRDYDLTVQLYHLLGFRMDFYRQRAIESLHLKAGDAVVDIACGTGNFSLLQEKIGPNGRIVGVDFTEAMLTNARERVAENHWRNVELVRSDVAAYHFPEKVDGVISTLRSST
jgi:ubiquinone/menaquinone biosynthesis C-methylase UbiE